MNYRVQLNVNIDVREGMKGSSVHLPSGRNEARLLHTTVKYPKACREGPL